MDAYTVLKKIDSGTLIDENYFNQLKRDFRNDYLESKKYFERISLHRTPIDLKNEVLRDLNQYLQQIQYRSEMRDETIKESGYVPTKIGEIWQSDRRLKTLYNSIKYYCKIKSKEFNVIAVHIAEYRSLQKLFCEINRSIHKRKSNICTHQLLNKTNSKSSMKSKEELQEIILDLFRKTNSKSGHIVMMRVINFQILHKLNPKEQDLLFPAINGLIEQGFLLYEEDSPECLRLTDRGFERIYDDDFLPLALPIVKKKKLPSTDFPNDLYKDILQTFSDYGKDLEKKPQVYRNQSEEGLRDHFLTNLTGRYEKTTATGETFNKGGKTDILLKDQKGNNLFIAECKWWAGAAIFHSTINQLFDNYITWRDTKVAIIFFVANKDFSNVLDQIEGEAQKHFYFMESLGKNNDSNFSFIFRQKDDLQNKTMLEIMLFHFP